MRLLLISNRPPHPPCNGGYQRTNLLHRALATLGDVDLLLLDDVGMSSMESLIELKEAFGLQAVAVCEGVQAGAFPVPVVVLERNSVVTRVCRRFNPWCGYFRADRNLAGWLSRYVAEKHPDVIVGRYLRPTARAGGLHFSPCIVDVDDLDSQRQESAVNAGGRTGSLFGLRWAERQALRRASHLWVTGQRDLHSAGMGSVSILPNVPFDPPTDPEPPAPNSHEVLFVGSWRYDVNVRAITRFIREVWPEVRRKRPAAVLKLVGWGMSEEQRRDLSAVPGVMAVGFVECVAEAYRSCACVIVPVQEGGGSKIKVLEALAHGRTCVLSEYALNGFEDHLMHMDSVWVAKTENELVEGCLVLLGNPELAARLGRRGAQLVREHFSWDVFRREVEEQVAAATATSRLGGGSGVRDPRS